MYLIVSLLSMIILWKDAWWTTTVKYYLMEMSQDFKKRYFNYFLLPGGDWNHWKHPETSTANIRMKLLYSISTVLYLQLLIQTNTKLARFFADTVIYTWICCYSKRIFCLDGLYETQQGWIKGIFFHKLLVSRFYYFFHIYMSFYFLLFF